MSGVICGKCWKAHSDARHPICARKDCPGREEFHLGFLEGFAAAGRLMVGQHDLYEKARDEFLGKKDALAAYDKQGGGDE